MLIGREIAPGQGCPLRKVLHLAFFLSTSEFLHNLIDLPAALDDTLCVRGALLRAPGKGQLETGYSAGRVYLRGTSPS